MIRPAEAADAAAIADLWNPVIRDTTITFNSAPRDAAFVAGMIAEKAASGHAFVVAEAANGAGLVGFASYGPFRSGTGYRPTMEHSIVLAPAAQGQGLGRALLAVIEDHARAGGAHCLIAGVSGENPQGRAFHAAMGYAEVCTLREVGWKFGRRIDLVLMQKFLT